MPLTARAWSSAPSYGEVFYARATGQAPEMESSKAAAKQLKGLITPQTRILDVGCGAGHYLRSLRQQYPVPFAYCGVDITPEYIDLAKKAFANDAHAEFCVANIEELPFKEKSFDIVLCCNVLLHLPAFVKPMRELWRVTKRKLVVRTQVGDSTFRIQHVPEPAVLEGDVDPVFTANGEPRERHFYNIYSERYVRWLCSTFPDIDEVSIHLDRDFDPKALGAAQWPEDKKPEDLTEVWNGWQVHRYILQPWSFIRVTRKV